MLETLGIILILGGFILFGILLGLKIAFDTFIKSQDPEEEIKEQVDEPRRQIGFASNFNNQVSTPVGRREDKEL